MLDYLKNILTLSGGTFISQIILLLSVPILTRIFTAPELGLVAFFLAIITVLSCFSTGKYDLAFFTSKNKFWVQNLFFGTILINFILFILLLLFIVPIFYLSKKYLSIEYTFIWFLFLPIMFFLNGLNTSLSSLLNKYKLYKYISLSRIFKNSILAFLSISLGLYFRDPFFIFLSHIISMIVVNLFLSIVSFRNKIIKIKILNIKRIIILFKLFNKFPLFTLPATFLNILSNQIPIIMLTTYFGTSVSGMFSLVNRSMGLPSKLISSATSEVFREKATEDYKKKKNCRETFLTTFKGLFLLSLIPFSIIFIFGPQIFSFIFGPNWIDAGYYARYLSLFYILRFSVSPLGFTLIIANRQDYNFYWQFFLLIFINVGLFIGYYYSNVNYSIICFSLFYSIFYLFYFIESYKSSLGKKVL